MSVACGDGCLSCDSTLHRSEYLAVCSSAGIPQARGILTTELTLHIAPFLVVLALTMNKQKGGFLHRARKPPYEKNTRRRLPAAFLCVVDFVVKRSVLLWLYATATGSLLRLRFGFSVASASIASSSASVGSAVALACSCACFALSFTIGMTTT